MKDINSVLIVDDSEPDRYFAERIIGMAEITDSVFTANNGEDALKFLGDYKKQKEELKDKFCPRVILLDINMPRKNGFEFLEEFEALRKINDDYSSIVITMYTSSDHPEDIDRAMKYDCVKDYLVKPISKEDLAKIQNYCKQ